jgi:hypothetical protein
MNKEKKLISKSRPLLESSEQDFDIYKLVGINEDGELIQLIKKNFNPYSENFSKVDDFIKKNVNKFLFNNGEGSMVRI